MWVRGGPEHGAHNYPSLGQPPFFSQTKRFLGTALRIGRGVTQEDPTSPLIFNIAVYVVMIEVLEVFCGTQEARHGTGLVVGECNLFFYADGRRISGRDNIWVQDDMMVTVVMF